MQFFKTEDKNTHQCFFSNLTKEQIMGLNLEQIDKTFKKGEFIFKEGAFPKALYVVYRGVVKVHKYGENGKEQITRLAKAGDLLGYRSLLSSDQYGASASAIEQTQLFKIPRESFFELIKSSPDFSLKIIQLLSEDLKRSEKKLLDMAQKSVREKVAETLLLLNEKFGLDDITKAINSKLTRKEIGDIAGVTTESTIRTMSDFNKEKIIQIQGKNIIINNFDQLKREAENKIA
jgi:CRP/FNR family transcriptional regulator